MKQMNEVLMLLAVFIITTLLFFGIASLVSGENISTGQSIEGY